MGPLVYLPGAFFSLLLEAGPLGNQAEGVKRLEGHSIIEGRGCVGEGQLGQQPWTLPLWVDSKVAFSVETENATMIGTMAASAASCIVPAPGTELLCYPSARKLASQKQDLDPSVYHSI